MVPEIQVLVIRSSADCQQKI